MKGVPAYQESLWESALCELFDEPDRQEVLDWLIANHGRRRVVLVGAGFSRNARRQPGTHIPIWSDIKDALAKDLRISANAFDALALADYYRREMGGNKLQERLLGLLPNDQLSPSEAHEALWQSGPEAVITTNFLDTLLDWPTAHSVIEDTDLALFPDKVQLLYFHGHRSDFSSWVIGRSDYDDLPEKRPLLFAKVRQLFAQFPLLVVGYSLTDPDFHMVYRQMVRCMDRRHPLGLALVVPTRAADEQAQRAESVPKKYWDDLGLRIVRFKKSLNPENDSELRARFRQFFELTRQVRDTKQLRAALVSTGNPAADFAKNVRVLQSAFEDKLLDQVWENPRSKHEFWATALEQAVPEDLGDWHSNASLVSRLDWRSAEESHGESQSPTASSRAPELSERWWLPNENIGDPAREAWRLLGRYTRDELPWRVQELLEHNAHRATILNWLSLCLQDWRVLDFSSSTETILAIAGVLKLTVGTTDAPPGLGHLIARRAEARLPGLYQTLQAAGFGIESDAEERAVVRNLVRARELRLRGSDDDARKEYEGAVGAARSTVDVDADLLEYFAEKGLAELRKVSFVEVPEDTQRFERLTELRSRTAVRRWFDDVKVAQLDLQTQSLREYRAAVARPDYEPRSFSWSHSRFGLQLIYLDAERLGAPVSVLRLILEGYSDCFDAGFEELKVRLKLNMKETPEWLDSQLGSGSAIGWLASESEAVSDASPRAAVLSRVSFELVNVVPEGRGLPLESRIAALGRCSECLSESDVDSAVKLLTEAPTAPEATSPARAWVDLARVAAWSQVGNGLVSYVASLRGRDWRDLSILVHRLPWQQWRDCDDVFSNGGLGLLSALVECNDPIAKVQIGWGLSQALLTAQTDVRSQVVAICSKWLSRMESDFGNDKKPPTGWESIAAVVAAWPEPLQCPLLVRRLTDASFAGAEVGVQLLLAESEYESELRTGARLRIRQAVQNGFESQSHPFFERQRAHKHAQVLLAVAAWDSRVSREVSARLLQLLDTTWNVLGAMAPALNRAVWESGEDWSAFVSLLRLGRHRHRGSWALQRAQLVYAAVCRPGDARDAVVSTGSELGFLRQLLLETLSQADALAANLAIYALGYVAPHAHDADIAPVCAALENAADDPRVGVAHGAAFAAAYVTALARTYGTPAEIVDCAAGIEQRLRADKTAIIARQLDFGKAVGEREARELGAVAQDLT